MTNAEISETYILGVLRPYWAKALDAPQEGSPLRAGASAREGLGHTVLIYPTRVHMGLSADKMALKFTWKCQGRQHQNNSEKEQSWRIHTSWFYKFRQSYSNQDWCRHTDQGIEQSSEISPHILVHWFSTSMLSPLNEKEQPFQQRVLGPLDIHL